MYNICSVPLEWTCSEVEKLEGEVSFLRAKFSIPRSNGLFSRSDSCQNRAKRDFGMSDLEKEPFDLGIENFALRIETSPASVPTSEQVHSRGTEHIFHCSQ